MTKRTLIERMNKRGAPMVWVAEIEKMLRERDAKTEIINEFANLIDVLAREKETLVEELGVAHYQIKRTIAQLHAPTSVLDTESEYEYNMFMAATGEVVKAQLESYLETTIDD